MSPAANDWGAVHKANERAFASRPFTYTPPDDIGGDPIPGLVGDYRDEPEVIAPGGDAESELRSGGLRIGVRLGQLPAGRTLDIEGTVTFTDGGAETCRVVDTEQVNGHAWLFLHKTS